MASRAAGFRIYVLFLVNEWQTRVCANRDGILLCRSLRHTELVLHTFGRSTTPPLLFVSMNYSMILEACLYQPMRAFCGAHNGLSFHAHTELQNSMSTQWCQREKRGHPILAAFLILNCVFRLVHVQVWWACLARRDRWTLLLPYVNLALLVAHHASRYTRDCSCTG